MPVSPDKLYTPTDFSGALILLKAGKRVARAGWNGKGMFLYLVPGSTFKVNRPPLLGIYPEGTEIRYHAHIDMRTADGQCVPWLASQTDLLAEDWWTVEDTPAAEPAPDFETLLSAFKACIEKHGADDAWAIVRGFGYLSIAGIPESRRRAVLAAFRLATGDEPSCS